MRYMIYVKAAKQFFRAETIEDAAAEFEAWRDEMGVGARDIGARFDLLECLNVSATQTRKLGHVFYNGRIELDVKALTA